VGNIVIVGFGSAGYAAVMAIKRADARAVVTVLDPKQEDLMHPCGLPYALEGHVNSERLTQSINLHRMGVKKIKAQGLRIDGGARIVHARTDEGAIEVQYDSAIVCTGSVPYIPPVKGALETRDSGLYTFTNIADLEKIRARIKTASTAIVIGAGAIGLETAVALKEYLPSVMVLEMKPQVLPGILDQDMSRQVEDYLAGIGVEMKLSAAAGEIISENGFVGVLSGRDRLAADLGILSAGFRANTEIARLSGIEHGADGIVVDDTLATSVPGVYAAGDCIAGWSVIDGKRVPAKLATCAYKQGTTAGLNAAGSRAVYRGTAGTFVTKIGALEVAGTGYTSGTAEARGYETVSGKITSNYLPEYFPGGSEVSIKVICDRASGKILGAQAIGERGAAERINLISMALEFGVSAVEFGRVELAYCPAVSEVHDPVLKAVEFAVRRMAR
jgi:NADH oxidase (H2O2-forming)